MAESFLIGGDAIRQLANDPLLPEPIVASRERRRLIDALRSYDRLGRKMWSGAAVSAFAERHLALERWHQMNRERPGTY